MRMRNACAGAFEHLQRGHQRPRAELGVCSLVIFFGGRKALVLSRAVFEGKRLIFRQCFETCQNFFQPMRNLEFGIGKFGL